MGRERSEASAERESSAAARFAQRANLVRPSPGFVGRELSEGPLLLIVELLIGFRAERVQRRVSATSVAELHTPIRDGSLIG